MTESEHLIAYSRLYPRAWELGEMLRKPAPGDPIWPDWCFLPMGAWHAILENLLPPGSFHAFEDMAPVAALGAWRYTQGIYSFDHALFDALVQTSMDGDLPAEVLLRLPEWCVYIETPGLTWGEKSLLGFFAFLEYDVKTGRHELRLVLNCDGDAMLFDAFALHLGAWSLEEAFFRSVHEAVRYGGKMPEDIEGYIKAESAKYRPLMPLLLYLCSDEPDITGKEPGQRPQYPKAKKIKGGQRLFPPSKTTAWQIGAEVGETLRQAQRKVKPRIDGHASPRAHIRRAHWHGYWMGPLKGERRFAYRWMPPMVVGVKGES